MLGYADALTKKGEDDAKISSGDLEVSDVNPEQLRAAHQAWDN